MSRRITMRILNLAIIWLIILAVSASPRGGLSTPGNSTNPAAKGEQSPDKTYWKHAFGPGEAGRAAMGAGISQATNTPAEWGQGAKGFGKRFASSFSKHVVHKAIQYPVAKMFHE